MTTITAPSGFSGQSTFGPHTLNFTDGKAQFDGDMSDGLRDYLFRNGYKVGNKAGAPTEDVPEPPDPRDYAEPIETSQVRDAAVDPREGDYLPPINAGQANPHGPLVVAPGIHGAPGKPIHPGPVGRADVVNDDGEKVVVKDTDRQAEQETALAQDVLVDQRDVPEATVAAAERADYINEDQRTAGQFDPSSHTVAEVNDYLGTADDTERARVLDAEGAKDGKQRVGVTAGPHGTPAE